MKTLVEYEASDIDLKDKLHGTLATSILLAAVAAMRKGEGLDDDGPVKTAVALFLNAINRFGYTIVKDN